MKQLAINPTRDAVEPVANTAVSFVLVAKAAELS